MYLEAGEKLFVKDLIYGLLLMSGNDAAEALASLYSGDVNDFVDLMNSKAEEIGLKNTHFTNPSGLDDDDHFSSARDLSILTEYALNNRLFASVVATPQKEVAKRFMLNHNKLLFTFSGAIGVKTGWTDSAGRCLVSAVERNGRRVIAVTLDAPDDWNDHEKLYAEAYYGIRMRTLACKGIIGNAYVAGIKTTPVCIQSDVSLFLSDVEFSEIQYRLIGDRIVYGNVNKGDKYGELQIILRGRPIATEPVFFTEEIIYFEPEKSLFQKIFKG
jgi:D-alanyl-D-alanine carboxypeptidase